MNFSLMRPEYFRIYTRWLCIALVLIPTAFAFGATQYVVDKKAAGSMPIFSPGQTATVYVDRADLPLVQHVAKLLSQDVGMVGGTPLQVVHDTSELGDVAIIAGTTQHSRLIKDLIARKKLDATAIAAWDGYLIQLIDNPLPKVKQALVIVGANKRGVAYGVFDLSEQMGVSPWHYWADVRPEVKKALYVAKNTLKLDAPKVHYRGIFLNDEAPALTGWVKKNHGNYNHEFYVKIFELLLRLKANYLWPAMWNNAFNDDDPKNQALADEYGIIMGTSHHEPMMRADKEWNRYGKGKWEFSTNSDNIAAFWLQGAKRARPFESLFTMGMRGQEDEPMSEGENIQLLQNIVSKQRQILSEVFNDRPIEQVPQVWCLYKEVQAYYEKGMRVPDDITLLWSDDNWGNIRRVPAPNERNRSGGAGVYYHFDYVGGPRSYRWINNTPIAKVWEQMNLAYEFGARKVWIVNVGDLKPMEFPTEYFLKLAWNPENWPKDRLDEYTKLWAQREFGSEFSADIAKLINGYSRHNGRRKPELLAPDTFSLLHYQEAQRVLNEMQELTQLAENIEKKIPARSKDAYFQLVLHPVLATANMTRLYVAIGRNHLFARQGRSNSDLFRAQAKQYFAYDQQLQNRFDALNNGKWRHFMDQSHIGYVSWNNPEANQLPALAEYIPGNYAEMGVAVEGFANAWPTKDQYALSFDINGQAGRTITVFNRGTQPFEFTATHAPWIQLDQTRATVVTESTLNVRIDWSKLPEGSSEGAITIKGTGWQAAKVRVNAVKREKSLQKLARGFIEADGYIAIEAANFKKNNSSAGVSWQEIPHHGLTQSSITPLPVSDKVFSDPASAPYVEYPLMLFTAGKITVETVLAPSWPFLPGKGLRYAISIGAETPQVIDYLADFKDGDKNWDLSVERGVRIGRSEHTINKPGPHLLRIYAVDSGVTLQRIHINTGGLLPSYLGPSESIFK